MNSICKELEHFVKIGNKYTFEIYEDMSPPNESGVICNSVFISHIVKMNNGVFILFNDGKEELLIETTYNNKPNVWELLYDNKRPSGFISQGQILSMSLNGTNDETSADNKLFNWISQDENVFSELLNNTHA